MSAQDNYDYKVSGVRFDECVVHHDAGHHTGDHFQLRKIERFTVLSGTATISLRRVLTDRVCCFEVTGDAPANFDTPTIWAHRIENVGASLRYTSFWPNDFVGLRRPDTIAETAQ